METLQIMGQKAKAASKEIMRLGTKEKNEILVACSKALSQATGRILEANRQDLDTARNKNMKESLIDRLLLTEERITAISSAMIDVAKLEDPISEVEYLKEMPNGLKIGKKRVPMGVIGMIYESRPNVTPDAFSLCFKAGSACILKGGSDAFHSNFAISEILRATLEKLGYNPDFVQLISDTSREVTENFMKLSEYLDLLIPRGGAALIQSVVKNATVPVIETGTGNCHIFIDESADLARAIEIVINAKITRPGTCNSLEKVLVHEKIAAQFLPDLAKSLKSHSVSVRACEKSLSYFEGAKIATEDDWYLEFLDMIIGVKIIPGIDEAINHIEKYSSHHSEAILTESYTNSQKFLNEVDSAAVYVNASTRFTDGFEFGFGAEIGISTQKMHARGPMGLKELTSNKFIIYGSGQIRE